MTGHGRRQTEASSGPCRVGEENINSFQCDDPSGSTQTGSQLRETRSRRTRHSCASSAAHHHYFNPLKNNGAAPLLIFIVSPDEVRGQLTTHPSSTSSIQPATLNRNTLIQVPSDFFPEVLLECVLKSVKGFY